METISKSKLWFETAQIKFTHCCVLADLIDILCVNLAKTFKIGTLKYEEGPFKRFCLHQTQ